MFVQTFEKMVHGKLPSVIVSTSRCSQITCLVYWCLNTNFAVTRMGLLSYYTYGLPTFLAIVIALYLLFTGWFASMVKPHITSIALFFIGTGH